MLKNWNSVEQEKRKCTKGRNDQKKTDGGDDNTRKVISLYNSQNTEKQHAANPKLFQMFNKRGKTIFSVNILKMKKKLSQFFSKDLIHV